MTAFLLACLMSSIVLLSSTQGPPYLAISKVAELEDGVEVTTRGILAELRVWDGGTESMLLLEPGTGATIRVVSAPALQAQPSIYASIGDELQATGELKTSESPPIMFANSGDIALLRVSEVILTVTVVCENWLLFRNDRITLCGILVSEPDSGDLRLTDSNHKHSISLDADGQAIGTMVGRYVVVDGCFALDTSSMSFRIESCTVRLRG